MRKREKEKIIISMRAFFRWFSLNLTFFFCSRNGRLFFLLTFNAILVNAQFYAKDSFHIFFSLLLCVFNFLAGCKHISVRLIRRNRRRRKKQSHCEVRIICFEINCWPRSSFLRVELFSFSSWNFVFTSTLRISWPYCDCAFSTHSDCVYVCRNYSK